MNVKAWMNMLFSDHGLVRIVYNNFYSLPGQMYRLSQPAPFQVRRLKNKYQVKTIINLRGDNHFGSFLLEKEACDQVSIKLINFVMYSRTMPLKEVVLDAKKLMDEIEYPAAFHCKSGADRAGLFAALYLIFRENQSVEEAKKQLAMKYGHFKQAKTGMLDHFFQLYLDYAKEHDITFIDWVEQVYDRETAIQSFHSSWWANNVVDKLLRRE